MKTDSLRLCFITTFFTIIIIQCYSQGELPVEMYTGSPIVDFSLGAVKAHDITDPIRLVYKADGIQLSEKEGTVGLGFQLTVGSSVTREVRSLPDDYSGTGADKRYGWCFAGGGGNAVYNMPNAADISSSTCADELIDFNTINSFNYTIDTEPDIFRYSVGGYSGQFVFDKDLNIKMMPYQPVTIVVTGLDETASEIIGFTIITNNGYKYFFNHQVTMQRWAKKISGVNTVEFLKRDFELYDETRHGNKVTYTSEWKLTRVESTSGAFLSYDYITVKDIDIEDTVKVSLRESNRSAFYEKAMYVNRLKGIQKEIYLVSSSSEGQARFNYENGALTTISIRDNRNLSADAKKIVFTYNDVFSSGTGYARKFLNAVQEVSECDKLPPYKFTYVGVIFESDFKTMGQLSNQTSLPPPNSKKKDFWGFYNGKENKTLIPKVYVYPNLNPAERYRLYPIPGYMGDVVVLEGADRTPGDYSIQIGSLQTVVYPWGGSTTIDYEHNQYYDETSEQNCIGGGLRIRSAVYYDGVNAQSKIIKRFAYEEPSHRSSGRLISRPAFAFPSWEYRDPFNSSNVKSYASLQSVSKQELWEHLTVRTENDLSSQENTHGSNVGYRMVKVERPGSGSAIFEFLMPGVFGESSQGAWEATENKFARSSNCPDMGIVNEGSMSGFPYSINPFYDYERGLLWRKQELNESGVKVRETVNTYQYLYKTGTMPEKVWGLNYDKYANSTENIFFYGKYFLLTDVSKVLSTQTTTVFDEADISKSVTDNSSYFYESDYHKQITRVTKNGSDGAIYTTKYKYPLDYGTIPSGSDKQSEMIGWLQGTLQNDIPIEQISCVKKADDVEKVISATLNKLDNFNSSKVLIHSVLKSSLDAPTSSFVASYVDSNTKQFISDDSYESVRTNLAFDNYGKILSSKGISPVISSTHWGYNKTLPVVMAVGTQHNEFAFSDFETTTGYEFEQSANVYGEGRTGSNALYPKVVLSKAIKKANVQNYILSFWVRSTAPSLSFRFKIKNAEGTSVLYENVFSVNSGSEFEHVERVVSVLGFPDNFKIEFQADLAGTLPGSNPDLLPLIDDVGFYPEVAELTTFTYDIPFGVNSVTNSRARTSYTKYDKLGRVTHTLDHDKNISQRNTYSFAVQPQALSAIIELPSDLWAGVLRIFRVSGNGCIEGETYEWDFGNGFSSSETTPSASNTFWMPGMYTVTVRVTHPDLGQVLGSASFVIVLKPFNVNICAKGLYRYDNCGQGVTDSYSCSSIASNPQILGTIFKASIDSDDVVTYKWYKRKMSSANWSEVSSGNQYETKLTSPYESYVVRCVATASDGRTSTSDEYAVFVTCGQ
jgi:hypothetical protein